MSDDARIIRAEASRLLAEAGGNGQRAANAARREIHDVLRQARTVAAIARLTGGVSLDLPFRS
jgi:hypothetical protein